jgi:hypothetical protein
VKNFLNCYISSDWVEIHEISLDEIKDLYFIKVKDVFVHVDKSINRSEHLCFEM